MKKLFSLLAVAAMAFTACQNDEGVKNPTLADEGIVNLSVGVPELATRTTDQDGQSGFDSAYGAIDYGYYGDFLGEYDVRFQLAVYEANAAEDAEPVYTATNYVDLASTTSFNDLRFVPGREYQFVVFADFVKQGTQEDFRYNTADLRNITAFEPLNAMDETYDAYFFNQTIKVEAGKINQLKATLKRPFAKVRVLTTDLAWVEDYAVPAEGVVTFYNHPIYKSFNAVTGEVATEATNEEETLPYAIDGNYYRDTKYNNASAFTLFATYVLATDAQETLNFRLDTKEADGTPIKSLDFNTEIPYQRNHLTTLVGNLLTSEADVEVRIDDNFDAEEFQTGDWDNLEEGLGYIREGVLIADNLYRYETNLFNFRLFSETDGTELREGTYPYDSTMDELLNARAFDIEGIDVEKGTLTIAKDGENYNVVFDIYATIKGVTENYILTWNGSLKGAREALATPVVTWEVDEVDNLYITFSWEAVEGAKNYTVEFLGEEQTVEGTSATFDFSGEDTYATAYVTANPEYTWSYTASTATVNVEWKKPIMWGEVTVMLSYVNGSEVAFRAEGLNIYVPNYPSLEDAWYQTVGQLPVGFSAEATLEETTGSAASVVIAEPTIATKFVYYGAMNPIVLTDVEINWVDGANTNVIAFSNENNEISFHSAVPLAEGEYTIAPETLVVEGDVVPTDSVKATTAFVTLKNNVYTVFFQIESAINDILMQYVGEINFEKPEPEYTADYVFTKATADAETITFTNENGDEFVIEATELVAGDVVGKKVVLKDLDTELTTGFTVVATDVTEENGIYDARYEVKMYNRLMKFQFVGEFTPYAPELEKVEITGEYTNLGYYKGHQITAEGYPFTIIVSELKNREYSKYGDQDDHYIVDGEKIFFTDGDTLTYDAEKEEVTVSFVANFGYAPYRYIVTASTKVEAKWNEMSYEATYAGQNQVGYATFTADIYTVSNDAWQVIDGYNGAYPNILREGEAEYTVVDGVYTWKFDDDTLLRHVTITYDENMDEQDINLTLEDGIYLGLYESTIYRFNAEGIVVAEYADGSNAPYIYEQDENVNFIIFTFTDWKNNVKITALYQKANNPVDLELTVLKATQQMTSGNMFYAYVDANNTDDNYVQFMVNTKQSTATSIDAGTYSFNGQSSPENYAGEFKLNAYKDNGVRVTSVPATMVVEKDGYNYDITITAGDFVAHFAGEFGKPDGSGNDSGDDSGDNDPNTVEETAVIDTYFGTTKAYISEHYMVKLDGTYWQEITDGDNYGTEITKEVDGNVTYFKFFDAKNNLNVTIKYTEEPETPAGFDPWTFNATLQIGTKTLTMTDGPNTIVATLSELGDGTFYINDSGVKVATINGDASGTIYIDGSSYKVTIDATINGVVYKGTSTNSAI